MRNLKRDEMRKRGCDLCQHYTHKRCSNVFQCEFDICPYRDTDQYQDYIAEYDKPIQKKFNAYIKALFQDKDD